MQIKREDWWATPIWFFDFPETQINPNLIKEECYKEQLNSEGCIKSNINGWQSDDIFIDKKRPYISNLLKEIKSVVSMVVEDFGVIQNLKLANAWININPKNSSNQTHTHPQAVLSGVYYVNVNEHSGDIIFYNDAKLEALYGMFLDNNNRNTYQNIRYKPKANKIILFPAWIPHGVDNNNSEEDRISIGFNFIIK